MSDDMSLGMSSSLTYRASCDAHNDGHKHELQSTYIAEIAEPYHRTAYTPCDMLGHTVADSMCGQDEKTQDAMYDTLTSLQTEYNECAYVTLMSVLRCDIAVL